MRLVLPLLLALAAVPARAETEVDIELVLAVDVSRSMSPAELEIQRRGYAEALTSDAVLSAIADGFTGRIALAYMEWAGDGSTRIVIDWTVVGTRAEAEAVAAALLAHTHYGLRRTSISSALTASAALFEDNGFTSFRQVIDVSGDGPNNHGAPVTRARDTVLAQGIVINGLPLMTRDTFGGMWHLDDLDAYYAGLRDRRSGGLRAAGPRLERVPRRGPPQACARDRRRARRSNPASSRRRPRRPTTA